MQPCMRLLLLPGEGQAVQRKSQARDERGIAGEVHRRIHQLTDHAAGALHLARWRNVDAPSVFLQTGHGTSEEICQRTYHRQLHTDQRHTAHRRVVPVFQGEQLAGGGFHRRPAGIPRRVPQEQAGTPLIPQSDARHQSAEEARRGMERHGSGERIQRRLSRGVLPLLQGSGMPLHPVRSHCRTYPAPR